MGILYIMAGSTCKVTLHSKVMAGNQQMTVVGEATKLRSILGKEEMERRLAERPFQKEDQILETQPFQEMDTGELYWRHKTDSFLGVKHEGMDPI